LTKQTDLLKKISAKVRARGVKPFTKAFGKAMKAEFKKLKGNKRSTPNKSKKSRSKPPKAAKKTTKQNKKNKSSSKSMAGKKGTSGMTRIKKLLLGIGIGAAVSTVAAFSRQPAIEAAGPIIDAAVGAGVEGQVGTAIPRLIRTFLLTNGSNGGSSNLSLEGA